MKISLLNASLLGCLLIAGCATTPPKLYSVADTSRAASLTLKSDQNYFIGAHTYENADNCVGISTLYELDQQQNSIKTVELEADKEFGLTVLVKPKAKSFYDYSCSFSLFFTPKENIHYEITSTLDEE